MVSMSLYCRMILSKKSATSWDHALDFFNLSIFQFHRRRTAEDGHRDLDPGAVLVDILDNAIEGCEGAVRDPHCLADFKSNRRLGSFDTLGDLTLDALRLAIGNRHRLLVGAQKSGDLRRILDQMLEIVGKIAFHQHVAGKEFAFRINLTAASNFDDMLGRDKNLLEFARETTLRRLLLDGFGDLFLEIRIGVNDIPAHAHRKSFNLFPSLP